MKKGETFSHDGKTYEVLQDDLAFIETQKSCIRPAGERKCILISKALKQDLIKEVGQSDDSAGANANLQLPLAYTENKEPDIIDIPQGEIAEPRRSSEMIARHGDETRSLFFLPVDQLRAQVFLAHGLLYPVIFDKATVSSDFDDIQKQEPSVLSLFARPQQIKKNQILLGVLLHDEEVKSCATSAPLLRFPMPLPISRVTSIAVSPEQGDLNRYMDGWIKPDVPVPRHLFSVAPLALQESVEGAASGTSPECTRKTMDIADSIRKFDRYMGLMAFLRNIDRYFSSTTGCYADYPVEFFDVCAAASKDASFHFREPSAVDSLLLSLLDQEDRLSDAARGLREIVSGAEGYIEKERARSLAMQIYKACGDNEKLAQLFKSLFSGDYRSAIQALQHSLFPSEARVLAALFKYSSRQSNDHRTVKQRLHEDWGDPRQVVPVLAVLGAYYGYTSLDARETGLYSVHPLLKKLVEPNPEIKFHMRTSFEQRLIETLYQWAFYQRLPDKNIMRIYADMPTTTAAQVSIPQSIVVRDSSYHVQDLFVKRFEVTKLGRIIHYIRNLRADSVDERSELGRCLLAQCFFLAEEFDLSRKNGKDTLRYRISKDRLADLMENQRITLNLRIIETAMEEDAKKSSL